MSKKVRKTLYLPEWITEVLDNEGEKYDGPGVVAAAAINAFDEMDKKNKKSKLKSFRDKEIEIAYGSNETNQAKAKIVPKKQQRKVIVDNQTNRPIRTKY